ncbi:hypothetical protein BVI1335_1220018 [Burkholderia vietnamiensis]|nr:hypothetical protein BVI1335_1220018 [Burkholderia vietnamiensis]
MPPPVRRGGGARRVRGAALTRPRRVQAAGGSGRSRSARARRPPQITARQRPFRLK